MSIRRLDAEIVATKDEANSCRSNVRKDDRFRLSRDLVNVTSMLEIIDEFLSSPLKPVKLVLRAKTMKNKFLCNKMQNELPGGSGDKAQVNMGVRKGEKEPCVIVFGCPPWRDWKYECEHDNATA